MRLIFLQTKSKSRSSSVPAGHRRGTFQVPKPPPGKNKDVVCTILWKQLWFCTLLQLHVEFGRKLFMTNQQMLFSPLLSFVMSIPRASNSEKSQCCHLDILLSTLFETTIFLSSYVDFIATIILQLAPNLLPISLIVMGYEIKLVWYSVHCAAMLQHFID